MILIQWLVLLIALALSVSLFVFSLSKIETVNVKESCLIKWSQSGLNVKYEHKVCMLEVEEGVWIPAENYRYGE